MKGQSGLWRIDPGIPDRNEVWRYARCRQPTEEQQSLLEEIIRSCGEFEARCCYGVFPVKTMETGVDLGCFSTDSRLVCSRLSGCDRVLIFGITLGLSCDRMLHKTGLISPARELLYDALCTQQIEGACDEAERRFLKQNPENSLTERFSPGYGDFPLSCQKDIFSGLDLTRKAGMFLNKDLMITPMKSVTALAGIKRNGDVEK